MPAAFAAALASVRAAPARPELTVTEIPAPAQLAPYAVALAADVRPARHGDDSELGTGRFILLYDPDEPEAWGGPFRIVCFAQAPLETDIGLCMLAGLPPTGEGVSLLTTRRSPRG